MLQVGNNERSAWRSFEFECSHFVLVGLFHGQKMFRDQLRTQVQVLY